MLRRIFLKNSTLFFCTVPLLNFDYLNLISPLNVVDQDVYKINIGNFECTLFRDTMYKYMAKDFFINADQDEVNQSLIKFKVTPENIPSPFIPIYLKQKDKKILIDTGIGFSKNPVNIRGNEMMFAGKLHQLLNQEKIINEEITDVILTHLHPDHVGGIYSEDGKLNFPNARFHMHEDEWNYWHSSKSDDQPASFKYFVEKNISKLKDGNLNLIRGDYVEILPGITSVKADGHTPGQIAIAIQSDKEYFLYISDAFLHPLHIEKLDWQTNYDLDLSKAKQCRVKLLDLAYKNSMLINAFHFDFPGLGRVEKQNNNWVWEYSNK